MGGKNILMKYLFAIITLINLSVASAKLVCGHGEVYVSANLVESYVTKKGKKVSSYFRDESCRKSPFKFNNFEFVNKAPDGWSRPEEFKKWSEDEIKYFLDLGQNLPELLKKIQFNYVFSIKSPADSKNPAMSFADSKTLIFYQSFFKSKNGLKILGHEVSHFLYWKLTDDQKMEFAKKSGWTIIAKKKLTPPRNPIYEDSVNSPAEDFANNTEAYYFDRERLQKNNPVLIDFFLKIEKEMK